MRPIATLLVANRGEIARRVFRTAHGIGIRSAAIYVDADAGAPFVRDADLAVRVGSYMDVDAVVAAAVAAGADAIHPGYGFLSENAAFASAVVDAGLTWVGPRPELIAAMGDKLEAKRRATAAGVPTLPSSDDPSSGAAIGFPLLVKAAAGGGGKGMRIVADPADLDEAVAAARREALGGFGDDTVFLERYVPAARHVEIQIMGDAHGTVVDHGERECSIQRRHQKIVEEAPSPGIDDDTRTAIAQAAVALGNALGFESAGTVEFLVDDETGEFFFLEVNPRLQVEHPVTEEARGIDLVREQLAIAMGAAATPSDRAARAAIEVRLYAEDAGNGFLPATGTLEGFEIPDDSGVRWEIGVEQGSEVTIDFDPMIGKVIAAAPDRRDAARRLASALERLHLGGVVTNRDFLVNVLRSSEFLDGATTTDFIERVAPSPSAPLGRAELERAMTVAALWLRGRNRAADERWGVLPAGFRNGRLPPTSVAITATDARDAPAVTNTVAYATRRDGSVAFGVGDGELVGEAVETIGLDRTAVLADWATDSITLEIDGITRRHRVTARVDTSGPGDQIDRLWVQTAIGTVELAVAARFVVPGSDRSTGGFAAPMPGRVIDVRVAAGDAVTSGQTLVVLEAMKMEHHMRAVADGVVAEVFVATGQQVVKDEPLLVLTTDDEEGGSDG